MLALLLFKAYTMLAQFEIYSRLHTKGEPDGWDVIYVVLACFTSSLLYFSCFHVAAGGSYMKTFLGENQKRALMVFLPLQVLLRTCFLGHLRMFP